MNKKNVYGIDLGTTNSCVALLRGGKVEMIDNDSGKKITPSVVSFVTENGKVSTVYGDAAQRSAHLFPKSTIYAFKRLIGRTFDSVQHLRDKLSYPVVSKDGNAAIKVNDKVLLPHEIAAKLLKKIVTVSNESSGLDIKDVVITVPAHFDEQQRQATKDAGTIAGLNVLRIISEPTAAAMSYGLEKSKSGLFLVYDFGGGTFDVTIMDISDGVYHTLASGGDTELGGEDFDNLLTTYFVNKFKEDQKVDLSKNPTALFRVKEAVKAAKEALSSADSTNISVPFVCDGPKHFDYVITRAVFESLIKDLVVKSINITTKILSESKIDRKDLSIVFVGGSTRVPLVKTLISKEFPNNEIFRDINPDEAVARGAAIQGASIMGTVDDVVLLESTALDFGIEAVGGVMATIIERHTTIPATKSKTFTTAEDNQSEAQIKIYQGNRKFVNSNRLLGSFKLSDISPAPRGIPQIEVTFSLDINGLLTIAAHDKKNPTKEQKVQVETSSGITREDIEKMAKDAEANFEADEEAMKAVAMKNEFTSLTGEIQNKLSEVTDADIKDKFAAELKKINEQGENIDKALLETTRKLYQDVCACVGSQTKPDNGASPEGSSNTDGGSQEPTIDENPKQE